jgi:hypothetical protein
MRYEILAIDLEKFSATPESAVILRLMWGINEMNQLTDLGKMIGEFEREFPQRWKYYEGLTASLTRQRSAIVGEVLDAVVRPLVADDAEKRFPTLHRLIIADSKLKKLRARLRTLFYGRWKKKFETHRQIRHRITAHFDHREAVAVLPDTLKLLVKNEKKGKLPSPLQGWFIRGKSDENKEVSRFLLVDDVLNTAWRETILGIRYSRSGYSKNRRVTATMKFTLYFMELFHTFAINLIDNYLYKNELYVHCNPVDLMIPPSEIKD